MASKSFRAAAQLRNLTAMSVEASRTHRGRTPRFRSHRRNAFTEVAAREAGFEIDRTHELMDFLLHLPE